MRRFNIQIIGIPEGEADPTFEIITEFTKVFRTISARPKYDK